MSVSIKNKILENLKKVSRREVNRSLNTTCLFVCHQPKMPSKVRELKKSMMK